ncbi:RNA-directed RNA polymerase [ssRNA phage SRR5208572_1]|uniref:RNA-directed RNA polymerase n=1 Tax=ssRNA phage SRR5208572_1 TaxID=2786384 RepID=A0A8S5L100_9VIRU|nr:RNA-directed RNA polymerase [ssRNA phage SRR5208572_1]DAD50778.1 TPA_asm: RNA-directed RNA polymerase [ssRNA phage SRR5208572_1]
MNELVHKVASKLWSDIGTPYSLGLKKAWDEGRYDEIATASVDPRQYTCADSYFKDAAAAGFLRKAEFLPTSFSRKANAIGRFRQAELACARTNILFDSLNSWQPNAQRRDMHEFFVRVRKKIKDIVGNAPSISRVCREARFGPGSVVGTRGDRSSPLDKLSIDPTVTFSASPFLLDWVGTAWATSCLESNSTLKFVTAGQLLFVEKDAKTLRAIIKSASVNVFYQLGAGSVLRDRLKQSTGIDLDTQSDVHRELAMLASIERHLCTLDLVSASDSCSREFVRFLFPRTWYQLLDDLREKDYEYEGKTYPLEKFSAMGNGFTFELETIIFLCIAAVVCEDNDTAVVYGQNLSTYGDDIIAPDALAMQLKLRLEQAGFTLNMEKSFWGKDCWFRESCGGDYFGGAVVRPYFLKELPNEPQEIISLANGIRRMANPDSDYDDGLGLFGRAWRTALDALPSHIRKLRGPKDLGDIVIHDRERSWGRVKIRYSIRYIRAYKPVAFLVGVYGYSPSAVLAYALMGYRTTHTRVWRFDRDADQHQWYSTNLFTPRDSVSGYKVGVVPFS